MSDPPSISSHAALCPSPQSLALALASVAFATLPTIAGFFPLWLAVSLHEGATVLVALNSLRLLVDDDEEAGGAVEGGGGSGGEGEGHRWNRGGGGLLRTASTLMETLKDVFGAGQDLGHHGCGEHHDHDHDHQHHHHGHDEHGPDPDPQRPHSHDEHGPDPDEHAGHAPAAAGHSHAPAAAGHSCSCKHDDHHHHHH